MVIFVILSKIYFVKKKFILFTEVKAGPIRQIRNGAEASIFTDIMKINTEYSKSVSIIETNLIFLYFKDNQHHKTDRNKYYKQKRNDIGPLFIS